MSVALPLVISAADIGQQPSTTSFVGVESAVSVSLDDGPTPPPAGAVWCNTTPDGNSESSGDSAVQDYELPPRDPTLGLWDLVAYGSEAPRATLTADGDGALETAILEHIMRHTPKVVIQGLQRSPKPLRPIVRGGSVGGNDMRRAGHVRLEGRYCI